VTGCDSEIRFGRMTGRLESVRWGGAEAVSGPLMPNFWRVPTDADVGYGFRARTAAWRLASKGYKVTEVRAGRRGAAVEIATDLAFPAGETTGRIVYTVRGDGSVEADYTLTPQGDLPEIPRIGLQMRVPARLGTVRWFGRGPHESYRDRKAGAAVGLWSLPAADMVFPFVRPQENGNRTDVRWFSLTDGNGEGLTVRGHAPLNFSVWPFSQDDLDAAWHPMELPPRDFLTVNIDLEHTGIGGDDSWGARPHAKYTILPQGTFRLGFRIDREGSGS